MRGFKKSMSLCLAVAISFGTALPWTQPRALAEDSGSAKVTQAAAGEDFMAARKSDGTVWTWGNPSDVTGYYEHPSPTRKRGLPSIKEIATTQSMVFALTETNDLYAWGEGYFGVGNYYSNSESPVFVMSGVEKIAAGRYHALALKGGRVYAWGTGADGQLGDGLSTSTDTPVAVITGTGVLTDVVDIAAGYESSYAITRDGTVYGWGRNFDELSSPVAIPISENGAFSSGKLYSGWNANQAYVVTVSGAVYGWGDMGYLPDSPTPLSFPVADVEVKSVSAGDDFALFLDADGQVWGIGDNENKELTDAVSSAGTAVPALLPLSHTVSVAAGIENAYAANADGALYTWGYGYRGSMREQNDSPQVTVVQEMGKSLYVRLVDGVTGLPIEREDIWLEVERNSEITAGYSELDEGTGIYSFHNISDEAHTLYVNSEYDLGYKDVELLLSELPDTAEAAPLEVKLVPEWYPEEMEFVDLDPREHYIQGILYTDASYSAPGMKFEVFFVDSLGSPIGSPLVVRESFGGNFYIDEKAVPTEAEGLRVYTTLAGAGARLTTENWLLFTDDPVDVLQLKFQDTNGGEYYIEPHVEWTDPASTDRFVEYELYLIQGTSYLPWLVPPGEGESPTTEERYSFGSEQKTLLKTYPIGQGTYNYTVTGENDFRDSQQFAVRMVDAEGNYSELFYAPIFDSVVDETNDIYYETEDVGDIEDVMFTDMDSDPDEVGGRLVWRPSGNADGYVVYFVSADGDGEKIEPYAHIGSNDQYVLDIPMNTALPVPGARLAVFPEDNGGVAYWGEVASTPSAPNYVSFFDTDGRPHSIAGPLYFQGLSKTSGIDRHEVFFTDASGNIIDDVEGDPVPIAAVEPNNYKAYHTEYTIMIGGENGIAPVDIPAGATFLGVRAVGADGAAGKMRVIRLWDDRLLPTSLSFIDTDPDAGEISPKLVWRMAPDESGISTYQYLTDAEYGEQLPGEADAKGWYALTLPWTDFDQLESYVELTVRDHEGYEPVDRSLETNIADNAIAETTIPSLMTSPDVLPVNRVQYRPGDPTSNVSGGELEWFDFSGYDFYNEDSYENVNNSKYNIYVLDGNLTKLKWLGQVKRVGPRHTFTLEPGATFPAGAKYFGVEKVNVDNIASVSLATVAMEGQQPGIGYLRFDDEDYELHEIGGRVYWGFSSAAEASAISGYEVYLGDEEGQPVGGAIATAAASASETVVPLNTEISAGRHTLVVRTLLASGEVRDDSIPLFDAPYLPDGVMLTDADGTRGNVEATLHWNKAPGEEYYDEYVVQPHLENGNVGTALVRKPTESTNSYEVELTEPFSTSTYRKFLITVGREGQAQAPAWRNIEIVDNTTGESVEATVNAALQAPNDAAFNGYRNGSMLDVQLSWKQENGDINSVFGYQLYFLNENEEKVRSYIFLRYWDKSSPATYITVPDNILIPTGATKIGIYAVNSDYEESASAAIVDLAEIPPMPALPHAVDVGLFDIDPQADRIAGTVMWSPAESEAGLESYDILFADSHGTPVGSPIGTVTAKTGAYRFPLPTEGVVVPSGATQILVRSNYATGSGKALLPLTDHRSEWQLEANARMLVNPTTAEPLSLVHVFQYMNGRRRLPNFAGPDGFGKEDVQFLLRLLEPRSWALTPPLV